MHELRARIVNLSPEKRAMLEKRLLSKGARPAGEQTIPRRKPTEPCLLSFCQQRLWFLDQLSPGTSTYNVPNAVRIRGPLDVDALRRTLEAIVGRYEVLRTSFQLVNGRPLQVIADQWTLQVPVVELQHLARAERDAELRRLLEQEARRPFDLGRDLMLRPTLYRLADEEYVFQLLTHHVAWDAWSKAVVYREMRALYGAFLRGRPAQLPVLPLQYADFALWQRNWLQGATLEQLVSYWERRLCGAPHTLELSTDFPRPAVQTFRGAKYLFVLPTRLGDAAKALSRQEGVTLFMTLLAAFKTFLFCYTGQEDINAGSPIAGRSRVETEGLVGFFINTLVLRTDLSGNPTFRQLLKRVKEVTLGAYAHQDLPFEKLVEVLKPPRDLGRMALFQVNFRVQTAPAPPLQLEGLTISPVELIDTATSKFDLALELSAIERFEGYFEYNTDLFKESTIVRMLADFEKLLDTLLSQPDTKLKCLELLHEIERRKSAMNNPVSSPPRAKGLRNIKREAVNLSQANLVKTGTLKPGQTLPLVLQPAVESMDLAEWAKNNRDFLETNLLKHGAILFRGFGLKSPAEFEKVAESIYSELYAEYGDLPREGVAGKIYTSTPYPNDMMILYHNESSHMHRWPMKISFYCVKPAEQGGATPIVDCREMCKRLDPAVRERFAGKGLVYVRNFSPGLDVSWQTFFHTNDRVAVEASCHSAGMTCEWTPGDGLRVRQLCKGVHNHPKTGEPTFFNQVQLHHIYCLEPAVRESLLSLFREEDLPRNVCYGDGSRIDDATMQHIGEVYEELAVRFPWQAGDMIMLENMLTAHARDPFEGTRKVVVAMGDMTTGGALT